MISARMENLYRLVVILLGIILMSLLLDIRGLMIERQNTAPSTVVRQQERQVVRDRSNPRRVEQNTVVGDDKTKKKQIKAKKKKGKKVPVEDECIDLYNQQIDEDMPLGSMPWLEASTVEKLCSLLEKDMSVLEWGCGGSTTFFSRFVSDWTCIEHNAEWANRIEEVLETAPHGKKVSVNIIPPSEAYENNPRSGLNDGTYEQFREYIEFPAKLDKQFHLIIDDGRARVPVGISVIRNELLAEDGVVLVHDWGRRVYHKLLDEGFTLVDEETDSVKKMAVLQIDE